MPERLHKVLAHAGLGSRRDCEELVRQGRVSVDGKSVTELGTLVDPRRQRVVVDGRAIKVAAPAYFLLHKPAGVVCSAADDDEDVQRAIDFAPKGAGRLHTVGRLDRDSEGLILLTNDGELTERLTHPRHDFPKTYHVVVRGRVTGEALAKLKKGIWLAEGKTAVSAVRTLPHPPPPPGMTRLEVELREGKNREIRRVMAKVGHPVRELRRVAIGPIKIAGLKRGAVRPLTAAELALLREAVGRGAPGAQMHQIGASKASPAAKKPQMHQKGASKKPAPPAAAAAAQVPRLPKPPAEPPPRRHLYEPDEDGVVVIRRPGPGPGPGARAPEREEE